MVKKYGVYLLVTAIQCSLFSSQSSESITPLSDNSTRTVRMLVDYFETMLKGIRTVEEPEKAIIEEMLEDNDPFGEIVIVSPPTHKRVKKLKHDAKKDLKHIAKVVWHHVPKKERYPLDDIEHTSTASVATWYTTQLPPKTRQQLKKNMGKLEQELDLDPLEI